MFSMPRHPAASMNRVPPSGPPSMQAKREARRDAGHHLAAAIEVYRHDLLGAMALAPGGPAGHGKRRATVKDYIAA
jgi:hypothetical protein